MSGKTCPASYYWWDGEAEGQCELPADHEPDDVHYGGLWWFDDNNEEVPEVNVPPELLALVEETNPDD